MWYFYKNIHKKNISFFSYSSSDKKDIYIYICMTVIDKPLQQEMTKNSNNFALKERVGVNLLSANFGEKVGFSPCYNPQKSREK